MKAKRRILWFFLLLAVPALVLIQSIFIQMRYLKDVHRMRDEQFVNLVNIALKDAITIVEREMLADYTNNLLIQEIDSLNETQKENISSEYDKRVQNLLDWNNKLLSSDFAGTPALSIYGISTEMDTKDGIQKDYTPLVNAYFYYNKALRDVVLNSVLSLNNDLRPLKERINLYNIEKALRISLDKAGITEPFAFSVYDNHDKKIGAVRESKAENKKTCCNTLKHYLFENIILGERYAGYLELTFYDRDKYIERSDYLASMILSTVVLLLLNIIGIIYTFKQLVFERHSKEFADNLTHELKTPLASIMIATDMLSSEDPAYPEELKKKMLKTLGSETKRLYYLIEKMLLFTLLDKGRATINSESINAHNVIEDAHMIMSIKCQDLGGKLSLKLDANNPFIKVDKTHFQNIIYNILDNAIKYKKPNIPPAIEITTKNISSKELLISIKDNGIGISKRDRSRIFKRYVRIRHGNLYDVKGFGLGLSYVKRIIGIMKGKIKVAGKLGVGTTMLLYFPLADETTNDIEKHS